MEKLSDVKGGNDPNENAVDAAYQPRLNDAKKGKDLWDMKVGESALDSNQRDEIIADMNRENNINNTREVLNGTAPADDKEVLGAQRTFARKYDEKVNSNVGSDADFDDAMNASQEELDEAFDMF